MTFRDKTGRTPDITMTGINGVNWEASFFNVGSLPYDEETDTYEVEDIDYLLEQVRDYCHHDGDFADLKPVHKAEDATIVYVDGEFYCEEELKEREFATYEFTSYEELKAWLDSRKDDRREAYYYGFMENFNGSMYTIYSIAHNACLQWFDDDQTVNIYEEI